MRIEKNEGEMIANVDLARFLKYSRITIGDRMIEKS